MSQTAPSASEALHHEVDHAPLRSYLVGERVLLAAQPTPADWIHFAAAGYQTVLNLRSDPERAATQAKAAAAAGLNYIHRPWPAYELEAAHLAEFAELVRQYAASGLVFHCRSATRVGLIWLLYRTQIEGWSRAAAEAELVAAGYDPSALETFTFCADDYLERQG